MEWRLCVEVQLFCDMMLICRMLECRCASQILRHYKECRTPRDVWCSSSAQVITSHPAYLSCTGFLYHGVSSSNCAALCTQFSIADVQLIWLPLCSCLMPSDHTWSASEVNVVDWLLTTAVKHHVWRACFLARQSCCMELTARTHPCWTWHSCF